MKKMHILFDAGGLVVFYGVSIFVQGSLSKFPDFFLYGNFYW